MKIKSQLVSTLLVLTLSSTVWSGPKPDRCPSVDVVKYRGLLYAQKDCSGITYAVPQLDRYGTSAPWIFAIENVTASDATDAVNKGTELLKKLSGNPEPQFNGQHWFCEYQIDDDHTAFSMVMDDDETILKLPKVKKNIS